MSCNFNVNMIGVIISKLKYACTQYTVLYYTLFIRFYISVFSGRYTRLSRVMSTPNAGVPAICYCPCDSVALSVGPFSVTSVELMMALLQQLNVTSLQETETDK